MILHYLFLKFSECPDGLLCTSTIPSHFKRYSHLLLAQSRANSSSFSSPLPGSEDCFSETNSGLLCDLEERWSLHQKPTESLRNVAAHPSLVTPCLRKSQSPSETSKKISSSSTAIQTSQQIPLFPESVNKDNLVGVGLALAEERDSQSNSEYIYSPLPENDFSSCEISYSPLQSDEETYSMDEKLGDSQQEILLTGSSKDGSVEEDDSPSTLFRKLHGSFLKDQQKSGPYLDSFLTQDKYHEVLYKSSTLPDSSQLLFQNRDVFPCDDPGHTDNDFALFPSALAQRLTSIYQAANAKLGKPECHPSQSNKQKLLVEESAVCSQVSLPLLNSEMPKALEGQGEGGLSLHPTQSKIRKSSSKNVKAKNNANSACVCRKALGGRPDSKVTVPNTENSSSSLNTPESQKMLPSGPNCPATPPSSKVMKQMDIGVYFGLPPKRKEEKLQEGGAVEGMNLNPVVSPNEKRSPRQRKRKAEKSLSDLEFDAKNLSESQASVELPSERSRHQRKRPKKSDSLQEGEHQKRSHQLNRAEARRVNLRKDKVLVKSPYGRLQRENSKIPESPNAGQLRTRTCPFYKKIPGKLKYQYFMYLQRIGFQKLCVYCLCCVCLYRTIFVCISFVFYTSLTCNMDFFCLFKCFCPIQFSKLLLNIFCEQHTILVGRFHRFDPEE